MEEDPEFPRTVAARDAEDAADENRRARKTPRDRQAELGGSEGSRVSLDYPTGKVGPQYADALQARQRAEGTRRVPMIAAPRGWPASRERGRRPGDEADEGEFGVGEASAAAAACRMAEEEPLCLEAPPQPRRQEWRMENGNQTPEGSTDRESLQRLGA